MLLQTMHNKLLYDANYPSLKTKEGTPLIINKSQCDTWADNQILNRLNVKFPNKKLLIPKIVYIVMTYDCNMNCKYCIQTDLKQISLPNNPDVFLNKIRNAPWLLQECEELIFFGGEALLMWNEIKYLITTLKKENLINLNCTFIVATNGFLLTHDKLKFMQEHNFRITLSHDGPTSQNVRGKDPFNDINVISFLQKFCDVPSKLILAPTLTDNGLIERTKLYNYYRSKLSNIHFGMNGFRPMFINKYSTKVNPYIKNKNYITISYLDLHNLLDMGVYNLYYDLSILKASLVNQLLYKTNTYINYYDSLNDISNRAKIRCNLNGDITAFHGSNFGSEYLMGNISDMNNLIIPKPNNYFPENPDLCKMCENCFVLPLCQGVQGYMDKQYIEEDCLSRFNLYLPIMVHMLEEITHSTIFPIEYKHFKHQNIFEQFFKFYYDLYKVKR